jgi:hypothetical protein
LLHRCCRLAGTRGTLSAGRRRTVLVKRRDDDRLVGACKIFSSLVCFPIVRHCRVPLLWITPKLIFPEVHIYTLHKELRG